VAAGGAATATWEVGEASSAGSAAAMFASAACVRK
jgi:hypothetical protein